jgi:hypothetical protein
MTISDIWTLTNAELRANGHKAATQTEMLSAARWHSEPLTLARFIVQHVRGECWLAFSDGSK